MDIGVLAQAVQDSAAQTSTAETVLFWVLAPVALGSAIMVVLSRSAVHAALWLVLDFFCLAVFYAAQDAPFLAAVQVIVYTGAIMVLFLFVLMLVGVDRSESLVETIRGQRVAALVVALGFLGVLVAGFGGRLLDQRATGLADANADGNVFGIARLLFTKYVFAFELTSALLIVAALGAMVLAHKEHGPRPTQRELATARFRGTHPSPLPGPGVYVDADAPATPARLPSGEPAWSSVAHGEGEDVGPTDAVDGGLGAGTP